MQRPLQPRQYWACTSKLSPGDGRFTRMPAPPAQRRVSDAADHAVGRGVVIARAIVVQRAHDLRCAPRRSTRILLAISGTTRPALFHGMLVGPPEARIGKNVPNPAITPAGGAALRSLIGRA